MVTDLPTKRDNHFSHFYLQDGGKKLTSIDMEQNYAIVALRIAKVAL